MLVAITNVPVLTDSLKLSTLYSKNLFSVTKVFVGVPYKQSLYLLILNFHIG